MNSIHKKLQNLFDEYKNKPIDKKYKIILGNIIYDFIHLDKTQPLYKSLSNCYNIKNKFIALDNLLNGKIGD